VNPWMVCYLNSSKPARGSSPSIHATKIESAGKSV
jgi:hypothetical protein